MRLSKTDCCSLNCKIPYQIQLQPMLSVSCLSQCMIATMVITGIATRGELLLQRYQALYIKLDSDSLPHISIYLQGLV